MEHDFYVKALIVGKVFSGRCKAAREILENRGGLDVCSAPWRPIWKTVR
jgi:hypothetical protein